MLWSNEADLSCCVIYKQVLGRGMLQTGTCRERIWKSARTRPPPSSSSPPTTTRQYTSTLTLSLLGIMPKFLKYTGNFIKTGYDYTVCKSVCLPVTEVLEKSSTSKRSHGSLQKSQIWLILYIKVLEFFVWNQFHSAENSELRSQLITLTLMIFIVGKL